MSRTDYTTGQRRRVIARIRRGETAAAAARAEGIDDQAARRWARAAGIGLRNGRPATTSPTRERAVALVAAGMSAAEAARVIGERPDRVVYWCNRAGVELCRSRALFRYNARSRSSLCRARAAIEARCRICPERGVRPSWQAVGAALGIPLTTARMLARTYAARLGYDWAELQRRRPSVPLTAIAA